MKVSNFVQKLAMSGLVLSLLIVFGNSANADKCGEDKTLSPYFYVNSDQPGEDQLPLKHTEADVNIAGVIADVLVKQVYVNEGENPLEAIYIFPASTKAAVYAMNMTIGERVLYAQIKERTQARQDYEQAKSEGKTASLLEQQRPNVFQMNVANIMPGDSIVVVLRYTEMLVPEEGVYEFVYPTVVGPRYSNQSVATASVDEFWVENPYMQEGETAPYTWHMQASLNAGLPIREAVCTSHDTQINFKGPKKAEFVLAPNEKDGGNKDFIIQYRLAGDQVESGILLYEGEEENFFVAMMQPPKRVQPNQIPGREYIFIVDVSGSMYGFPLDISKKLLSDLIGNLKPTDRFNVLLFAASNSVLSEKSLAATPANIQKAINLLNNQSGGGGTQLLPALKRALDLPQAEGYSRNIVIATDGYVSVEREAFDLIRNNLGESNFFSFGIGSSVNRFIIEGMARVGMGEPFVITSQGEAKAKADKFRKYINSPVLTDIQISYQGFEAYDVEPSYIPDVLADRPIIIQGKWKGKPEGTIAISGVSGTGNYSACLNVEGADNSADNSALKYLWARNRIALLDDYNRLSFQAETKEMVTQLGIDYNLLTQYTSFVAIDNQVRNENGELITVKQPLPLPEGVSGNAVGGGYGNVGMGTAMPSLNATGYASYSLSQSGGVIANKEFKKQTFTLGDAADQVAEVDEEESFGYAEEKSVDEPTVISGLNAGTYSVRVRDANGCVATDTTIIAALSQQPSFPGGEEKMKAWIKSHMKKPENNFMAGTVWVKATVNELGQLTDVKIETSLSKEADAEALRLVKAMPHWQPGIQNGKAKAVTLLIPVDFMR